MALILMAKFLQCNAFEKEFQEVIKTVFFCWKKKE